LTIAVSGAIAISQDGSALLPVADHHVHLRSPAVTQLFGEQIPVVSLPKDVEVLLTEFERHWRTRNAAGVAALFTPDGVMQVGRDWRLSPRGIQISLLGRGGSIRMSAQAFAADDALGYVAGSLRGDREEPPGDAGRFMFAIRRSTNGAWRIAAATLNSLDPEVRTPATTVDELIAQLDEAGIRRAAVHSWAYQFGGVGFTPRDEAAKVRAENDWTAQQVTRYADRLVGFCSVNPLKEYALKEIDDCMRDSRISGLKLHFTTAGIELRNPDHVVRLRDVFSAANTRRFPIVVHLRTLNPDYGVRDAEIFLGEVLAEAGETVVHIAHLAGWGGFGPETQAAFGVFADAAAKRDPRVRNLYFDTAAVVSASTPDQVKLLIAHAIRRVGPGRILFAIDGPVNPSAWEQLRALPLEDAELRTIAANLAPYMVEKFRSR
jgi:predicted TIM-barrel fold metal-dependent hydrolase